MLDHILNALKNNQLPDMRSVLGPEDLGLHIDILMALFDSMLTSRLLDETARDLKQQGKGFYTIASAGHECNAALGLVFPYCDIAFLHYRSGAFIIQRSKQIRDSDPIRDIVLSLMSAKACPISAGRHKVFGSKKLNIPPQTSTIASHLPKAVGCALSLRRAEELAIGSPLDPNSVVLCSFGDASFNHASAQAALNTASWISYQKIPLPIVFICEDNGLGISVPTPKNWIENTMKGKSCIKYIACDGVDILDTYRAALQAEKIARVEKRPVFLHMKCVRLFGHAGSDVETEYLSDETIAWQLSQDPLLLTLSLLIQHNQFTCDHFINLIEDKREEIQKTIREFPDPKSLQSASEIIRSLTATISSPRDPNYHNPGRQIYFQNKLKMLDKARNMSQLMNYALADALFEYPNTVIMGEDVGKKGGVYHVTADLQKQFGQRRVFDTLLDETSILGTAIGMAHNGFVPIVEIQFLAYVHNAEDQLRGEACSLSFFSDGQFHNPMIVRIPGLAYQKGFGGHFHNDNSLAVLRDIPGLIIAVPSRGGDAVKMFRHCMKLAQAGRVIAFVEPIALYMTKDCYEIGDNLWLNLYPEQHQEISLGEITRYGNGEQLIIITYANGLYLSIQAQRELQLRYHVEITVIDCHYISPLPIQALREAILNVDQVLIVDECRESTAMSAYLMSQLNIDQDTKTHFHQLNAIDSYVTLGTSWQYLMPSKESIIKKVLTILGSDPENQHVNIGSKL